MIKPDQAFLLYHLCQKAHIECGVMIVESTREEIASAMKYTRNKKNVTFSKDAIYRLVNSLIKEGLLQRCNRSSFSFIIPKNAFSLSVFESPEPCDSITDCTETVNNEKQPNLANEPCEPVNTCEIKDNNEKQTNLANGIGKVEFKNEPCDNVIHCESSVNNEKQPNLANGENESEKTPEPCECLNSNNDNDLQRKNGEPCEPLLNNLNNISYSVKADLVSSKDLGIFEDNKNSKASTMGNETQSPYHSEPEHTTRSGNKRKRREKKAKGGYVKVENLPASKSSRPVDVPDWKPRHFVGFYRSKYFSFWRENENLLDGRCESWKKEIPQSVKAAEDIKKMLDKFEELGCDGFSNLDLHRYIEWYFREWYGDRYVKHNKKLWEEKNFYHKFSIKSLMNDAPMETFITDSGIYCSNKDLTYEEEEVKPTVTSAAELEENLELFDGLGFESSLTRFGFVLVAAYRLRKGDRFEEIENRFKKCVNRAIYLQHQGVRMNHLKNYFSATVKNGPYWDGAPFSDWLEKYKSLKSNAGMSDSELEYSGDPKHEFGFLMQNFESK